MQQYSSLHTYLGTLGEGGVELAAQLVSALEHRDHAAVAAAVRYLHQLVCDPLEILLNLIEEGKIVSTVTERGV